jgi:Kef-type K+ transport system membrane component KefB/mannitol/fructose-specific phosphotransferase system IIA component (Ntr-type)
MELSLSNLLLVLLAGWLAGWAATRVGYPSVLGELLIGILLGPPLLGLLTGGDALAVLAEVGILLMMLYVGMEVDPRELGRASWPGLLAALGGFVTPFVLAYLTMIAFGASPMGATFVGIAAGVTSLTTKSRILVDLRLLDTRIAHVMMAGALVSDTLSLVLFAAVLGVVEAGALDLVGVGLISLRVIAFFAVTLFIGLKIFPYIGRRLTDSGLTSRTFHFTFVLLLAVAFGELAHLAGLHAILGAFLAGLFLRDNVLGRSLSHDLMGAVRDASIGFLAPIFFVTAGFEVSLEVFRADLPLLLSIVLVATVGKIAGTAAFYAFSGNGWREGLTIGGGMNGRGAVEIIVAGIGLEMGLISREVFSILVFMAIFTTATVPFFLKWGTEVLRRRGELVRSTGRRRGVLILGAGPTARVLGKALGPHRPVWLVDTNAARCEAATADGLSVTCGNALQEQVLSDAHASEAELLIALTSNTEVNALVAQHARAVFTVPEIAVVHEGTHTSGHQASLQHLRAEALFGTPVNLAEWDRSIGAGMVEEQAIRVDAASGAREWLARVDPDASMLPLMIRRRGGERMVFHSGQGLQSDDEIVFLQRTEARGHRHDRFDDLLVQAPVIDLPGPVSLEQVFIAAAQELARSLEMSPDEAYRLLWEREKAGSTVLSPGLAVPHVLLEGEGRFLLLVARCRDGVRFPGQEEPVHAIFVLAGSADQRTFHLRALSAITQIVHNPAFALKWANADGTRELRALLLSAERRRF